MKGLTRCVVLLSLTWTAVAGAQTEVPQNDSGYEGEPAPNAGAPVPPAPVDAPMAPAPAQPPVAAAPVAAPPPYPALNYRQMPATIAYRADRVPPAGYVLSEEPRKALLIPGISALAAAYISGLIVVGGVMEFPNKTGYLAIPAIGPWITLATRRGCDDDPNRLFSCAEDGLARRMLIFDGIIQGVGTGLIVLGLTWTKDVWLREDLANVQIVPTLNVAALPGAEPPSGFSVVGHF